MLAGTPILCSLPAHRGGGCPPGAGEKSMRKLVGSRKLLIGAACAALVAGLASVPILPLQGGAADAQGGGDVMVPWFEADPYWPKPLPNHWVLAMTIGLDVDKNDNVWIVHRPQTLEQKESYAARKEA